MIDVSSHGYEPSGEFMDEDGPRAPDEALRRLLSAALLASDADVERDEETGRWLAHGDPTEAALVVVAGKAGLRRADLAVTYPRVQEKSVLR